MLKTKDMIVLYLLNVFVGFCIFIMIEVVFGSEIQSYYERENISTISQILIINGGFFISMGISLLSIYFSRHLVKTRYLIYVVLLTYIINLFLWIFIAYLNTLTYFSFYEIFYKFVNILTLYASLLPSATLLWIMSLFTFSLIFVLLLRVIKAPISLSSSKKHTGLWI